MKRKTVSLPSLQARAAFAPTTVNEEKRTVELTWSKGSKGLRQTFFDEYYEELAMDTANVRMDRLNTGAPVLNSHQARTLSNVIGVVEKAWLENGEGRAVVRFSEREDVEPIFQDVKSGIIRNVSVGYNVYKYEDVSAPGDKVRTYRATDWEPMEISMVAMGFDASASVRSADTDGEKVECEILLQEQEEQTQDEAKTEEVPQETKPEGDEMEVETADVQPEPKEAEAAPVAPPQDERAMEIIKAVRTAKLDESFALELIEQGIELEKARTAIHEKWAAKQEKQPETKGHHTMEIITDEKDKRAAGMENALLHRANPGRYNLDDNGRQFTGMSLLRMAEEVVGSARGLTKSQLATRALSTSDFAITLGNVAGKSLRDAYAIQPQTFRPIVRQTTLPDYKEISRIQFGAAPTLELIKEGGEYKHGSIGEAVEKYSLSKYGKIISLTEETIINDDLDAMSRIPAMFGNSAARLESSLVWGVITANAAMNDGIALFHASHGNLAGTAAAIGDTSLNIARKAIRSQMDIDSKDYLDLEPKYLIVGPDKETEAKKYMATSMIPKAASDVNPFMGAFQIIVETRLTGNQWYLACDPGQVDMIELGYLEGMAGPQIETMNDPKMDGIMIKCKHVVAAKAIDHRGFFKNAGA